LSNFLAVSFIEGFKAFLCLPEKLGLEEFIPQMPKGMEGMVQEHARTAISHYGHHLFFHIAAVAMDGAFSASGFAFAKLAFVQACVGILQELPAVGTQAFGVAVRAAVETYHFLHRALFIFYSMLHRKQECAKCI
jgi:hypothetical protein